ncbi:hypothetical protein KW791_00425 [Candidatus Parcubacteria bacterium]|nr:hypothetical protein [Candidatus Parcubacteria bacterium]
MKITLSKPSAIRKADTCFGRYAIDFDGQYEIEGGKTWKANKTVFFWSKQKAVDMLADLAFRNVIREA